MDQLPTTPPRLRNPVLVAVWPGMGQVAVSAGFYLLAKLGMQQVAEIDARDFFDVDHVEVRDGLIRPGRRPQGRLFVWRDPAARNDVVLFVGEAQPAMGKYAFSRELIRRAQAMGVQRVFTFAAMATDMHPTGPVRVFGAATDAASLAELRRLELELVNEGQIGGLNGVLLGAAAEAGLRGICLLGEMPQLFLQVPFPAASVAVLETFAVLAGIALDVQELAEQSREVSRHLGSLLANMQEQFGRPRPERGDTDATPEFVVPEIEPEPTDALAPTDVSHIEQLFLEAHDDRAKAVELKGLLDRLGVFARYEDRFLDLFRGRGAA